MIACAPPIYHFNATHHHKTVHVVASSTPAARVAAQHYFHTHKLVVLQALRTGRTT